VEHGVDGIIAVDVLADGFVGSPTDVRDSILRAVTFVAANQTTRALELLRGRVPVALLRLRSSATLSIDDFSRTQELIVLGRTAGDRCGAMLRSQPTDQETRVWAAGAG